VRRGSSNQARTLEKHTSFSVDGLAATRKLQDQESQENPLKERLFVLQFEALDQGENEPCVNGPAICYVFHGLVCNAAARSDFVKVHVKARTNFA
jgi:hypothetical protein